MNFCTQIRSFVRSNGKGVKLQTKSTGDVYAILFEKREEDNFLLGDHNFSDERIVNIKSLGRLKIMTLPYSWGWACKPQNGLITMTTWV